MIDRRKPDDAFGRTQICILCVCDIIIHYYVGNVKNSNTPDRRRTQTVRFYCDDGS